MGYEETVGEKIRSSTARKEQRSELWADIAKAYEEGGAGEVESLLAEKMEGLAVEFRHVLEKLKRML
jgi:hypothetical protein